MSEQVIEISISESGVGPNAVFTFHLKLNSGVVGSNRALTIEQSRSMRHLANEFGRLFEGKGAPRLLRDKLAAIGAQLFDVWLAPSWATLSSGFRLADPRILIVATDRPAVLNLPWELLRPKGAEPIGADGKWALRRLPFADRALDAAPDTLPPGPLRVLHMVCAPQDQHELDFEREEELMLRAFGGAGRNVIFDSGDLGTFEELGERINDFRPHIVHLTAHGVAEDETAFLCFEDDRGGTDLRSTAELGQLFAGSDVQCAFLSACQAGKAPSQASLGGLAQGLTANGVPLVIGWAASIQDDVAIEVAQSFYRTVSAGRTTIDRALVTARQAARTLCEARDDPSWPLLVLYAGSPQTKLFDPTRSEPGTRPSLAVQLPLPGMTEGYTASFLGRRRELQALLPGLRDGTIQVALLTGLGGAGKSTLATRLARKLEADGWTPLALPSTSDTPLSTARVLEMLGDAFRDAGERDLSERLRTANITVPDRLRSAVAGLNKGRFVVVLDNFESNLDEGSRSILDDDLAGFYRHLLANLVGGSRLIVTSRYRPADVERLPSTAIERGLGEFREAAFLKFLLRDEAVERRYRTGELPHTLLIRLHNVLGATPRFLGQIRIVLADITIDELGAELDRVALPGADDGEATDGKLQKARDEYCESIFTERLYRRLSEDSRLRLSRAAVYGLPVTVEALAALANEPDTVCAASLEQWRSLALAHVERSGDRDLWTVYGMLRCWLLAPDRLQQNARVAAHIAAGDFLVAINEKDREGELGVGWVQCLLEARAQYIAAGAFDKARAVTEVISAACLRKGLYAELEQLHKDLQHREPHPDTLNWLGRAAMERGQYGRAKEYYEQASVLAGDADSAASVLALHSLASINVYEGNYAVARVGFAKSLAILQQIGDRAGEASALHQIANIDVGEGDYATARVGFAKSLAIHQQIGDRAGEAATLHGLAGVDLRQGAYSTARTRLVEVLNIYQQLGDRSGEAASLYGLATIDMQEGDYVKARAGFSRVLTIRQQIGDRPGEAATWHQIASIDLNEGDHATARMGFAKSLTIKQQIGNRAGEATTLHQIASIDVNDGDYVAARTGYTKSLAIKQQIGDRAGEAASIHQIALIDMKEGNDTAAREGFAQALVMLQTIGDRVGEAATWSQYGALAFPQGKPVESLRMFGLCFLIDQAIGHGNTDKDFRAVAAVAQHLGYTQEQLDAELRDTAEAYRCDRGASLLAQAFPPE